MDKTISLKINDQDYNIDYSGLNSRDGAIRYFEPALKREITAHLSHIPYFVAGRVHLRDGVITEEAILKCRALIPHTTRFYKAMAGIDSEKFYTTFWNRFGRKKLSRYSSLQTHLNEVSGIRKKLKRSLKKESLLDNREKSLLFGLLKKGEKDIQDQILRQRMVIDDSLRDDFLERTGIDFIGNLEIEVLSDYFQIFREVPII
ncbi:MAG: hypothetical protein B6241_00530 [Spirochaetaceae bacterium 4572_59]|nr:MAG: hypothetical protein B6241_00530 [Spirochaetaceae bacterium 4572_59]